MAKKPNLKLVPSPALNPDAPPANLGQPGLSLWRRVMAEYDLQDTGGREMLAQACAALDRAESLAARIAEDGEIIHSRAGPKDHPGLKHELACRAFICRTLARLGLDVEPVRPMGRPPGYRS